MKKSDILFEKLIKPIENQMDCIIRRIVRDPEEAIDAFQNVLEQIWLKLKRIDQHPNPHAHTHPKSESIIPLQSGHLGDHDFLQFNRHGFNMI